MRKDGYTNHIYLELANGEEFVVGFCLAFLMLLFFHFFLFLHCEIVHL